MVTSGFVAGALSGAAGIVLLWAAARAVVAARRRRAAPAELGLIDRELDAAFDAVLADHAHELGDLLETRLRGLMARQVPVRAIRPSPGTHTARVCFADGTVVLARSSGGRELSAVVIGMQKGSVVLAGFARGERETRLDLRAQSGRPLALLAVGLDQPD